MLMLFRWQGFPAMADWWRQNNANGEWAADVAQKFNAANVRWAETTDAAYGVRYVEEQIVTLPQDQRGPCP